MSSYYLPLLVPPALDAPTALTLTALPGLLAISLVQPVQVTTRFSYVEVTFTEDDWTDPVLLVIPADRTTVAMVTPTSAPVWVRAWAADSFGGVSALTGEQTTTTIGGSATLVPITVYDATTNLWTILTDGDGNAVMEEV